MDTEPTFEAWYRREYPRVLALLTVVAGDTDIGQEVTAEAFTRALERWDRVAAMTSPEGWTYRVGVNVVRRRLRRTKAEAGLWVRPGQEVPAPVEPELWFAIRDLPERQRTAIALRYICDLPQAEVADVMGIAPGTASATLTVARRSLAAALGRPETSEVPFA